MLIWSDTRNKWTNDSYNKDSDYNEHSWVTGDWNKPSGENEANENSDGEEDNETSAK